MVDGQIERGGNLVMSRRADILRRLGAVVGQGALLAITSIAALAVVFIIYFIARDAIPFFRQRGIVEFFTSSRWYPSQDPVEFGALAMFVGTGLVTLASVLFAMPLGVAAAVCLSDVLPFGARQVVKPVIEVLAAIPSVAYGFFALVVLAPLFQEQGGRVLAIAWWLVATPVALILVVLLGDLLTARIERDGIRRAACAATGLVLSAGATCALILTGRALGSLTISSGTNALNVSVILGIMALPTVVSVSEDALQAVGRDLREGSYALGATRAETLCKTIIPAASSGILAAVLLGLMRAVGETMVVWMASGNAAQVPVPFYNLLEPVRTLTATIAGDMGEADHVTGSARYHVLFAMGLCLLVFSFACNHLSEWVVQRQRRRLRGES